MIPWFAVVITLESTMIIFLAYILFIFFSRCSTSCAEAILNSPHTTRKKFNSHDKQIETPDDNHIILPKEISALPQRIQSIQSLPTKESRPYYQLPWILFIILPRSYHHAACLAFSILPQTTRSMSSTIRFSRYPHLRLPRHHHHRVRVALIDFPENRQVITHHCESTMCRNA